MGKNKTTIDDLAVMVQKGFRGVDERLDKVESRLDSIENRLDAIEVEILDIKKKLDNIIYRHEFEILKDRVVELEKKLVNARKK